ncbi:hypothetical protein UlMin_027098 [Ulmus minor]
MTTIYDPILSQALVYIDGILLFSPDTETYKILLAQFAEITQQYGGMLSEKKMLVGQSKIELLGIKLFNGQYEAQSHIAQELLRFPDENLKKVQIQQFLGIVNYLKDFVPNISKLTSPLSRLLKKNSLAWIEEQTVAVKKLKQIMQTLPPLQILSEGKIILQTDASGKH